GALSAEAVFAKGRLAAGARGAVRLIGASRAKGKPEPQGAPLPAAGLRARPRAQLAFPGRAAASSKRGSAQQVGLPQRVLLTFSLSVFKPTAPTRTSLPTT